MLGVQPLTSRSGVALGLLALVATLSACDLPGAHASDAATVNGHTIPRARWDHLVQVTTQQLQNHVKVDLSTDTGKEQVKGLQAQSLRALVREEVIEELAAQRGVAVTEADLDREVAQVTATLGGEKALTARLDQTSETPADLRHTLRINLLQSKMRALSKTYDADYNKAVNAAQVEAYVPPCDGDHTWPQCSGGPR